MLEPLASQRRRGSDGQGRLDENVVQILREAVDRDGVHPEVAVAGRACAHAGGDLGFEQWIKRVSEEGLRADNPAYTYLEALAKAQEVQGFNRFVADNRQWLRESVFTWGAVGYGMAVLRRYRQLTVWMADWRQRTDAQPWMLVNAAEGFWGTGKDKEAGEICGHALALAESPAHNMHRILMAGLAVMRNDLSSARNYMQRVQAKNLHPDCTFIVAVVQGVLEMEAAERAGRAMVFQQVRNALIVRTDGV